MQKLMIQFILQIIPQVLEIKVQKSNIAKQYNFVLLPSPPLPPSHQKNIPAYLIHALPSFTQYKLLVNKCEKKQKQIVIPPRKMTAPIQSCTRSMSLQ